MPGKVQKLLAIAALAGGIAFAGAPPGTFVLPAPPQAPQPAQERPIPSPPVPEPRPEPKSEPVPAPPVAAPPPERPKSPPSKPKTAELKKLELKKAKTAERTAKAAMKQKKQVQSAGSSYCDNLRRRMAATPNRVFSCAEMKRARSCERPGDREKATSEQKAAGFRCFMGGEL